MNPGKRAVDRAGDDEGNKSPRLSGSLLAALQKDVLQRVGDTFESRVRPLVREEIERVLSRLATCSHQFPQEQIAAPSRKLRLQFISNPAAEAFTGKNLEGEHGATIRVQLVDGTTGQAVMEGPESAAELEVVPLMTEFAIPDDQDWTADEFKRHVAKEREGKGPLLAGELKMFLTGGLGTLGLLYFTDNSSWTRSRKFRLGVLVSQAGPFDGPASSIREGKSTAFLVKDSRGISYKKHDIPSPTDEVWRLRNIQKNGPYHVKLREQGIQTVQDFQHWITTRPEDLKNMLGKMPATNYQDTVNHAGKCMLGDNYQTAHGNYVGFDVQNDTAKVQKDAFVKSARNPSGIDLLMVGDHDGTSAGEPLINLGNQRRDIPSLWDEVWHLQNIGKQGPYHTILMKHHIYTVRDFLLWIETRPADLENVLSTMSATAYRDTVNHALKCVLGDKVYVYPVNEPPYDNVIFTHDYQTVGAIAQGQYIGLEALNDKGKVQMDAFVKSAYENWGTDVTECMVGDAAIADEPFNSMASTITAADVLARANFVQDPMLDVQAPGYDMNNYALVEELRNNKVITDSLWDYDLNGTMSTRIDYEEAALSSDNIASSVQEVLREYAGNVNGDSIEHAPTPATNRWWLRIRTAVRCALFIRNAGFALQHQRQPEHPNLINSE